MRLPPSEQGPIVLGSQGPVRGNEPLDLVLLCLAMFLKLASSKVALGMSGSEECTVPGSNKQLGERCRRPSDIRHTQGIKSLATRLIFIVEKHTFAVYTQQGSSNHQ
jgi:hypothetical protein